MCAGLSDEAEGGWTYEYVPGAGDDEESWGRGLTPQLLWAHKEVAFWFLPSTTNVTGVKRLLTVASLIFLRQIMCQIGLGPTCSLSEAMCI